MARDRKGRESRSPGWRADAIRDKHHRRNADTTTDQQRVGSVGRQLEGLADRPQDADDLAARLAGQELEAMAVSLVKDFDPVLVGTHDR